MSLDSLGASHANALGYHLHSVAGGGKVATYTKLIGTNVLYLDVVSDCSGNGLKCKIVGIYELITLSTGQLQFPHPRIDIFENQIIKLLESSQ